ncbi:hypothetical protein F53441_10683 [Fusarium austroafricanum]|uniref:PNPLA domain-containing protein n=1 Tax=Fusarium austroafricanum TaxID=2364996 RepID=A0A8H4NP16_9HYPO|nr:hypothetical protein F53441_10683 [Fusarium austroafricanum]
MLGRLQMDVDECIASYNDLIKVIFNDKARVHQSKFSLRGQTQARFDSKRLQGAIEKTIRDKGLSPSDKMMNSEDQSCKVFVCATSKSNPVTYRFRSYDSHKTSINATICQAARATSAATTFFDPVSIGGMEFVDGALGANNPVDQVEEEAMEIWCPSSGDLKPLVKCFISIGTGNPRTYNIEDRVDKFVAALAKMATDAEKIAEASVKRWRQHFDHGRYFRFNVEHGLQTVGMKEYRKKGEIQAATYRYLDTQAQSVLVQKCVENLILKKKTPATIFYSPITQPKSSPSSKFESDSSSKSEFGSGPESEPGPKSKSKSDRTTRRSTPKAALVGLGGSGKTQIALYFVEWIHETYPEYSVFRISGANLQESYLGIAEKLNLFDRYQDEFVDPDVMILFHHYLTTDNPGRWFLIIDDADSDDTLFAPGAKLGSVFHSLPKATEGRVLFITRSMKVATAAVGNEVDRVIKVDGLDNSTAFSLFGAGLINKDLFQNNKQAQELLQELYGLPLAINQAAKYLNDHTQLTADKFLALLRSTSGDALPFILQEYDGPSDKNNSVAKILIQSFEAVRRESQDAAMLLEFISQIGSHSIPQAILPGAGTREGKATLEDSIGTLCSFFFLVPRPGGNSYDMPTVVHLSTRVWVQQSKAAQKITKLVAKRLDKLIPVMNWSKRSVWKKYEPHAIRVLSECEGLKLEFDERFQLAAKVGSWLLRERKLKGAIPWLEQALAWAKKSPFKNSQRRLRIQLNLVEAYAETKQAPKAVKLAEKAMGIQEKHLPKDDTSLVGVSCFLARAHRYDDEPGKEIDRLEKLKRLNGKRSVEDKFALLSELGKCYSYDEKYEKAIENLKLGISTAEGKISSDDPVLLITKNHIAYVYARNGQEKDAIMIYEEILPIQQRILGKTHQETLDIQVSLAMQYFNSGQLMKAISLLEELVAIQRGILGETHSKTMSYENYLAKGYSDKNETNKALGIYYQPTAAMSLRSIYLAKSGGGANQRAHFALFIPSAEYDRDTICQDYRLQSTIGTRIHVVGEPLMSGFAFEVHRNCNLQVFPDLKQLVFLAKTDDANIHDSPTAKEIRESTPRSVVERHVGSVPPPPKGQDIRAPIDGVNTKRCQEWTMEVLALLVEKDLIPYEVLSIAQNERDPPTKGIFGYKGQKA